MTGELVRHVSLAVAGPEKYFEETCQLAEQNRGRNGNASKVSMLINSLDAYDIIPHHEEWMHFTLT